MSGENTAYYEEFCASLQSYVDPDGEDSRDAFVAGYAKLPLHEILELSEIHDLAAMFSGGMAVTEPVRMNGFVQITPHEGLLVPPHICFYVKAGHAAEHFLRKLCGGILGRPNEKEDACATLLIVAGITQSAILQLYELLTLASQDKDIRGLILDGVILAQNNPKKQSARRS